MYNEVANKKEKRVYPEETQIEKCYSRKKSHLHEKRVGSGTPVQVRTGGQIQQDISKDQDVGVSGWDWEHATSVDIAFVLSGKKPYETSSLVHSTQEILTLESTIFQPQKTQKRLPEKPNQVVDVHTL